MATGEYRRGEVQDPNEGRLQTSSPKRRVSARNTGTGPAITVHGVKAHMPNGAVYEALDTMASLGYGVTRDEYVKAKKQEFNRGAMLAAAGSTEEAMRKERGTSGATERGYRAMGLLSTTQRWYDDQMVDATGEGSQMDPVEFADRMSVAFQDLYTGDPDEDALMDSLGTDLLMRLGTTQRQANAAFLKQKTVDEYERLLVATGTGASATGVTLADLVDNQNPPVSGMTEADMTGSQFNATRLTLSEDRPDLYVELAEKGFPGMSPGQRETLGNAYEAFQERQRNQYNRQLQLDLDGLLNDASTGQIGITQGLERLEQIRDAHNQDDGWINGQASALTSMVRGYRASQRSSGRNKEPISFEIQAKVQDVLLGMKAGAYDREEAYAQVDKIMQQNGVSDQSYRSKVINQVLAGNDRQFDTVVNNLEKLHEEREKKRAKLVEAADLARDPVAFATSSGDKQKASFDTIRAAIAEQAQAKIASGIPASSAQEWAVNRTLSEMARLNFADPRAATSMTQSLSTGVLDDQGQTNPEALQSLEMFRVMRDDLNRPGVAEKLLKTEDARNVAAMAVDNLGAYSDPEEALRTAYQAVIGAPGSFQERQQRAIRDLTTPEGADALTAASDAAIRSMTQGSRLWAGATAVVTTSLGHIFGNGEDDSATRWWVVDEADREYAMANSTRFRDQVTGRAQSLMLQSPGLTAQAAATRAANELKARSSVVAGQIVTAPPGMSIRNQMGLDQFSGTDVEQAAVERYIAEYGMEMWGSQFNTHWDRVTAANPETAWTSDMADMVRARSLHVELIDDGRATALRLTPIVPKAAMSTTPMSAIAGAISKTIASIAGEGDLYEDPNVMVLPSRVVPLAEIGGLYRAARERDLDAQRQRSLGKILMRGLN